MIKAIKIPQVSTNEENVTIIEWFVEDLGHVKEGDDICSVETSKAVFQIVAEKTGYVKILVKELNEVKTQSIAGYIADTKEELDSIKESVAQDKDNLSCVAQQMGVQGVKNVIVPSEKIVSDKAKKLAHELGVDLEGIDKKVIREKDIYAVIAETKKLVDREFLESVAKGKDFSTLSQEKKIALYRKAGAYIGKNVSMGQGCSIICDYIHIDDNVTLGEDVYIEAEKFHIGIFSSVGNNTKIVTGEINIGKGVEINQDVIVDLSGGRTRDSKLIIGDRSLIAAYVYINTSRTVELENNVALSPYAKIYTHAYWQSVLDGYYADFKNVKIKSNSWIGSAAQIMPGVVVNEGSIVLSNSTVVTAVEAQSMVAGVPAQVIRKKLKKELTIEAKIIRLIHILKEFKDYLEFRKCNVNVEDAVEYSKLKIKHNTMLVDIVLLKKNCLREWPSNTIVLSFGKIKQKVYALFDLVGLEFSGKEDVMVKELRNFLRRYGIVFSPLTARFHWQEGLGKKG
jgi:acetyltransferase-like isoleucine patch superfamily enzyme